jgi:hypothetical protein
MYTTRIAAALTIAIVLGGCATAPSHFASQAPGLAALPSTATSSEGTAEVARPAIRFDNQGREHVRVYLVDERRQWLLGRVEPGARTTLRIPDAAVADATGPVRLSVLAGDGLTGRIDGDARAATMATESLAMILTQRWAFTQTLSGGQLTWMAVRPK